MHLVHAFAGFNDAYGTSGNVVDVDGTVSVCVDVEDTVTAVSFCCFFRSGEWNVFDAGDSAITATDTVCLLYTSDAADD